MHRLRCVHRRVPRRAIFPDDQLDGKDEPYLQINADYYRTTTSTAAGAAERRPRYRMRRCTAIVGAPAALYAAEVPGPRTP